MERERGRRREWRRGREGREREYIEGTGWRHEAERESVACGEEAEALLHELLARAPHSPRAPPSLAPRNICDRTRRRLSSPLDSGRVKWPAPNARNYDANLIGSSRITVLLDDVVKPNWIGSVQVARAQMEELGSGIRPYLRLNLAIWPRVGAI
ncbi:hypothetical protein B296_00002644 [Ensete ventricosum]|uniref:Uncharacterized protein n=1 Tax=Ensete ventricosum TaxID=4639 RepID=A0A427AY31_ENSVE|nr:hypothetical protein B296_00002644 [Ensete ventricosum]